MRLSVLSAFSAALAGAAPLAAQQPMMAMQPPQVVTQAQGEVQVSPDRASVLVAVETRASTAAVAASENARIQTAVLAALRTKLSLGSDQLSTMGYSVNPEYDYSTRPAPGKPPRVAGYVARNTIRAELRKIEQVGPAIDAALAAGANNIQGVNFWSSTYDQSRRQALAVAINKACEDGKAMAQAAGLQLGQPLEISSHENYGGPRPMMDMARARGAAAPEQAPTPIEPGMMSVNVTAMVRWRLLSAGEGAPAAVCGTPR